MRFIDPSIIKQLKLPIKNTHKGDNGKLTIIGGSKLFHGSTMLALQVASRLVDMTYFVSVEENLEFTNTLKNGLYSFIAVPYGKEADYIEQSDAVLIGPGMVRGNEEYTGTGESGEQVRKLVLDLLEKFPNKKWVLDAGALQSVKAEEIFRIGVKNLIVTPHKKEFTTFFETRSKEYGAWDDIEQTANFIREIAGIYNCTIVLKGPIDIITDGKDTFFNKTGNEGMTKGGTGDVLAGLVASLATTNDALTATLVGTYMNGFTGDELYKKVGPYFNADDLAKKVPEVIWRSLNHSFGATP